MSEIETQIEKLAEFHRQGAYQCYPDMVFAFNYRVLRSDCCPDLGLPYMAWACIFYPDFGEDHHQLSMAGSTESTGNRCPAEVLDWFGIRGTIFQQLSANNDWWRCDASL